MTTMRSEYDIVLDAQWQGDAAFRQSGNRWTELSSAVNIAQQGFQVAKQAAEVAYQTISEGAAIQATEKNFESLSDTIGITADALENRMVTATDRTVDSMTLMESANQLMVMGLVDNAEQVAKNVEIVTKLKKPTEDTATAMENWALLLANQSIPRLDSFGISGAAVRERIKELQAEMPGLSRETAFMQATMEQAEIAMGKVADQSDELITDLAQLETAWTNLTDAQKENFASFAAPFAAAEARNLEIRERLRDLRDKEIITGWEYFRMSGSLIGLEESRTSTLARLENIEEEYNQQLQETAELSEKVARSTGEMWEADTTFVEAAEESRAVLFNKAEALRLVRDGQLGMATSTQGVTDAMAEQAPVLERDLNALDGIASLLAQIEGTTQSKLELSISGLDKWQQAAFLRNILQGAPNDMPDPYDTTPYTPPTPPPSTGDEYVPSGTYGPDAPGSYTPPGSGAARGGGSVRIYNYFPTDGRVRPDTVNSWQQAVGG